MREYTYRMCVNEKKKAVIAFAKKHNRLPRKGEIEAAHTSYQHYYNLGSDSFDPIFRRTLLRLRAIKRYSPEAAKNAIIAFVKRKGKLPKKGPDINPNERRLGVLLRNYTDRKAYPTMYDRSFVKTLNAVCKNHT